MKWLKSPVVVVSIFLGTMQAQAKTLVISDVDDTIKISYVRSKMEMVSFSAFADSLFFAMNDVYQELEQKAKRSGEDMKFYYLSNGFTPTVEEVHTKVLRDFDFPKGRYISRPNPLVKTHKLDHIRRLINIEKPERVIFIGDNGEKDPIDYRKIVLEYAASGIHFSTHIHMVYDQPKDVSPQLYANLKGRDQEGMFPAQLGFLNAAELAVQLFDIGQIDRQQTSRLVSLVEAAVQEQKANAVYGPLVAPFFKRCRQIDVGSPLGLRCESIVAEHGYADRMDSIRKRICELVSSAGLF